MRWAETTNLNKNGLVKIVGCGDVQGPYTLRIEFESRPIALVNLLGKHLVNYINCSSSYHKVYHRSTAHLRFKSVIIFNFRQRH